MNPVLDLSPHLTVLPIVYASGDFALEVRSRLRQTSYDCLAVPLPPSFAAAVEQGVEMLPQVSIALQAETAIEPSFSFVPIDPCQGVIAAIREAMEADAERAYIDLEVAEYEEQGMVLPDPYALKKVALEKFLAALLPALPAPLADSQRYERISRMAYELHRLELEYERVVFVCSVADWPWLRQAYQENWAYPEHQMSYDMPRLHRIAAESLYFVLGELPYITYLYEHRRAELMGEDSMAIDGVKALLLEAREVWMMEQDLENNWLTPQRLSLLLKYVRNLTVMDNRLTPDLYNLALASKQVVGDDYALALLDAARNYPPQRMPSPLDDIGMGIGEIMDGEGEARPCKNRLQSMPRIWRNLPLKPNPPAPEKARWRTQWDPFGQVSYPPEDDRIESFQQHVRQQARLLIGDEQAKTEKFSSSLKDGLDIRETLRNWHTGDIYVRQLPPARGQVEVVVFLFETAADSNRYNWRSTWFAEHEEESTLCFFATPFAENMIGPGIAQALYGGCFFIFPPRPIPDIWQDPRFDFATSMEERLVAGALFHSREKRVVLVGPQPPSARWRKLARSYKRQLVYMPLKRFSHQTVDRLRRFHVLNGKDVRSYAARYIRDMR
jgi:hypothetical protein